MKLFNKPKITIFYKNTTMSTIKLNIGGTFFQTSLSTLTRIQDTFFTSMFSTHHTFTKKESDGSYFIDRNPKYFEYILKFMRDDKINIDGLKYNELLDILDEAKYYLLTPMIEFIEESNHWKQKLKILEYKDDVTKGLGKPCFQAGISQNAVQKYQQSLLIYQQAVANRQRMLESL